MATVRHPSLSLFVLASFLLANGHAWVHLALVGCRAGDAAGCCDGSSPPLPAARLADSVAPCCREPSCGTVGPRGGATRLDDAHMTHRHARDACVICRFVLVNKSLPGAAEATVTTVAVSERIVRELPVLLAAEQTSHPDCRAPPFTA
jgi:hypothetical protein